MTPDPVVKILLDTLIIIGCARLVGSLFRRFNLPSVVGEIAAGIILGPSLLGWLFPGFSAFLFPTDLLPALNVLSQTGLVFFLFIAGMELKPEYLKGQLRVAIFTSNCSILLPLGLGIALAPLLYPLVGNPDVSFAGFALFLGAAMSITALPVLARIVTESHLQTTPLGNLALACAAVDDISAWCLLAVAIAVTRANSFVGALPTILLAVLYVLLMFKVVRNLLQRFSSHYQRTQQLDQTRLALIVIGLLSSALITERIGIHLIFGSFLFGVMMPNDPALKQAISSRIEDFTLVVFLPVFFVYSGLQTQIGLLNTPFLWVLCLAVLLAAVVGKYCGAYAAARFCGVKHRIASDLGWLMNTRGLTELIILNIGLSLKVISPVIFTMLVIMALVTTSMSSLARAVQPQPW